MNPEVIHVTPDSPVSVLELFSTSKEGITLFASKVINEVEAGYANPLRVRLLCDTMEKVAEKIKEATKSNVKKEAAKYGEKPFEFGGAELHLTTTKTSYDYSVCEDSEWNELDAKIKELMARKAERETFLKALKQPVAMLDGEVINPPLKQQWEGVKVTIK